MTPPEQKSDWGTARVLVSLKLRLLRNGLRRSGGRAALYVTGSVAGVLLATGAAVGMAALHGHPGAADAAVVLTSGLALGWAALPLFLFVTDESADPTRLTMLPLRPAPLLRGMLLSALIGPGAVTSLLLLSGAAVAASSGAAASGTAAVALAVVAVPLATLTLVVLARSVAVANARLLSSRRGRDFAIFGGLLFALLFQGANIAFQSAFGAPSPDGGIDLSPLAPVAAVFRWIPPVSAIGAIHSAGEGSYAVAAAQLVATALLLGGLLRWWLACLERLMVTADSSTLASAPAAVRKPGVAGALLPRLSRLLPDGRAGVVMQRQLRYAWREPRAKMAVFSGIGMTVVLVVLAAVQGWLTTYVLLLGGLMLGLQMLNVFGLDGSAFWLVAATLCTPSDARAELRGRALAVASYALPFIVILGLVTAALGGGRRDLPEAVGLTCALLGVETGIGAVLSVLAPYAMPADNNPMRNAAPGQSVLLLGNTLGMMVGTAVLTAPLGALVLPLHLADGPTWVMLPAGALYGLALAALGIRIAAGRLLGRLPEILATVIER